MNFNMYWYYDIVSTMGKVIVDGLAEVFLWFTLPMSDTINAIFTKFGIIIDVAEVPIIGDFLSMPWCLFVTGVTIYLVFMRAVIRFFSPYMGN